MLGAVLAADETISFQSLSEAVKEEFPKSASKNIEAMEIAYNRIREEKKLATSVART